LALFVLLAFMHVHTYILTAPGQFLVYLCSAIYGMQPCDPLGMKKNISREFERAFASTLE
jgi:hypothetical protein